MDFPFEQEFRDNILIRTFNPDVDSQELVWHQDLKDREVKIIESGGWYFQNEDELPIELVNDQIIQIPKNTWHRVIKGFSNLIVEIKEKN